MAKNCAVNNAIVDNQINQREIEFESVVKDRVNSIMGIDKIVAGKFGDTPLEKEALTQWLTAKNNLVSHIVKYARYSNYSLFTLDSYLRSIENAVQFDVGIPLDSKSAWESGNPRRFLAMAKAINRYIHLQNSRWGKKLPILERAFLPIRMFGWRIDPIGRISKYIDDVTNILENSRNSSAKYKDMYNEIMATYRANVLNAVNSLDKITSDQLMGGVEVIDVNGNRILYLGQEDDKHRIKNLESGKVELVSGDSILIPRVKDALVDKYTYELTNDILHGQTRYVRWKNDPTLEHKKKIQMILHDIGFKIEAGDEKDLISGHPEIHTMTIGDGIIINYVVLKDELPAISVNPVETYSAYILSHKDGNNRVDYFSDRLTKIGSDSLLDVTKIPILTEGFFRSDRYKTFGKRIFTNKTTGERFIPQDAPRLRGWDFSDLASKKLKVDPNIALSFIKDVPGVKNARGRTLFGTIHSIRLMYDEIGNILAKSSEDEFAEINAWLEKGGKAEKTLMPMFGAKDAEQLLGKLKSMFLVHNQVWIDKNGGIHTPNSHFVKLKDNYAPIIYEDSVRDRMIDEFIERLSLEIEAGDRSPDKLQQLDQFRLIRARIDNNDDLIAILEEKLEKNYRADGNVILAQRDVYTKHRVEWTDPAQRRKDSLVHSQYVDTVFNNIHRNKLMVSMLEALQQISTINNKQFDLEMAEWIINRAMIAYADPMQSAKIGNIDLSYQKFANVLNKLPGNRKWDAKAAQKLVNGTRGFFAATLLGSSGALINRTQIVNEAIKYGWNSIWKSARILQGKDADMTSEQAMGIINFLGIDEVTNMLVDFMAHGGNVDMSDAGLIATPVAQIPTFGLMDFAKLVIQNRDGFIQNGMPELDKILARMETNRIDGHKQRLKAIEEYFKGNPVYKNIGFKMTNRALRMEENRLKNNLERRKATQLREAFVELVFTPKNKNNRQEVEARVKRLMGDITDNRLKRMVSWKLSWWFDGFSPELFTFTESERFMRRQSAIIALMAAANMGQLGTGDLKSNLGKTKKYEYIDANGVPKVVNVPSIFLTEEAKRIARNAVTNSMFGMSSLHLGDAFAGFGSAVFQFKSYPLQQMIHDYKVVQSFMDSSLNAKDVPVRLYKALQQAYNRARSGVRYTDVLGHGNVDHEAMKVLRFVSTRIGMTMFSVAAESIRLLRPFIGAPMYGQFMSMLRGGENPAFGIAFRLAVNGLLWASMDEDDWFEGSLVDIGWDLARLFFPVFITFPLFTFSKFVD